MLKIGLTGGIASGKSAACGFFVCRGAHLIDADTVAREVVQPGRDGLKRIVAAFGSAMLTRSGDLDREKLGQLVFADAGKRKLLDELLHPIILADIFTRLEKIQTCGLGGIVIADIPLLFECGLADRFDRTVLVYADPQVQQQRLMSRNSLSLEAVCQRLESQMPIAEKRDLADFVIDNSGTLAELAVQVDRVWAALCEILKKTG